MKTIPNHNELKQFIVTRDYKTKTLKVYDKETWYIQNLLNDFDQDFDNYDAALQYCASINFRTKTT